MDEYHYMNEEKSAIFTIGEELGHIILHLNGIKIDDGGKSPTLL